jgi:hypothetical protein
MPSYPSAFVSAPGSDTARIVPMMNREAPYKVLLPNQRERESLYGSPKADEQPYVLSHCIAGHCDRDGSSDCCECAAEGESVESRIRDAHRARPGLPWNKLIDSAKTDSRKVTKRPRGTPRHQTIHAPRMPTIAESATAVIPSPTLSCQLKHNGSNVPSLSGTS